MKKRSLCVLGTALTLVLGFSYILMIVPSRNLLYEFAAVNERNHEEGRGEQAVRRIPRSLPKVLEPYGAVSTNNLSTWSPRWTVESGVATIYTLPTQAKDTSTFTQEVLKPVRISADELKETLFPIQNSSAKPYNISRMNISSLTVLPRPSEEEEAVGMCFYGLFRFIGTVERMWQRTKPNLDGIPKRNIFISTWDYMQFGVSYDKSKRRTSRAWFQHGHPVDDMPKRLEAIFKEDLKGYYIGDHRGVSDICFSASCVVAIVRSNCLSAVHAYEQQHQKFHRYFMFQRIDRSLEIPMWFTPGCGSVARDPMETEDACHFQAGYCLSYFRKRYFLPMAKMVDGKMTTHTFLCRWKDRYTMTGMSHMSDYAAIGTRDTVATLLVGVFEHLFRDLKESKWVAEKLVAKSAVAGNITVYPVNMGYDRMMSMFGERSNASTSSLQNETQLKETAASSTMGDESSNTLLSSSTPPPGDALLPHQQGAEEGSSVMAPTASDSSDTEHDDHHPHSILPATNSEDSNTNTNSNNTTTASTRPPSTLSGTYEMSIKPERYQQIANMTCGSLSPKYLVDTCDYTGNLSASVWTDGMPRMYSRWSAGSEWCCDSIKNCIFVTTNSSTKKKPKKPKNANSYNGNINYNKRKYPKDFGKKNRQGGRW